MTKKEIVKKISEDIGLTQLKTKDIVQRTLDAIIQTLVSEGRIELRNFGVFEVKQRAPRKARNPRTGDKVYVPSKNVVTFKPGKEMEELVRKIDPSKLPLLEEDSDADLENNGPVEPVSENRRRRQRPTEQRPGRPRLSLRHAPLMRATQANAFNRTALGRCHRHIGGQDYADRGERNLARAGVVAPGGESPGSDPCKECAGGLIRAVTKTGGARHAETVRGPGDHGRVPRGLRGMCTDSLAALRSLQAQASRGIARRLRKPSAGRR